MSKQPEDHLFAWFLEGEDSFMGVLMNDAWHPLVFATEARAIKFLPIARQTAQKTGKRAECRQYKFEKIWHRTGKGL